MKFLDRDPVQGDRVWFAAEAVYLRRDDDGSHRIQLLDGLLFSANSGDIAGVIAPEPKVGDVVTADMDLSGALIEKVEDNGKSRYFAWSAHGVNWWVTDRVGVTSFRRLLGEGTWRIVRIGGAS